jgi:hypothetical protein
MSTATLAGDDASNGEEVTTSVKPNSASGTTLGSIAAHAPAERPLRAMDKADVILLAPSRCGKTPTTMYLALQHGIFVANYPLVDEDLDQTQLPRPIQALRDRCYSIVTTPAILQTLANKA